MSASDMESSSAVNGTSTADENDTAESRRDLRAQLRKLCQDITDHGTDYVSGETDLLTQKLNQTDELFQKVTQPREAAIDAQIIVNLAQLGKKKVDAFQPDFQSFNPVEFVQKIKLYMEQYTITDANNLSSSRMSDAAWIKLGEACQPFFMRAPYVDFMFGAFRRDDPLPSQKKVRQARVRERDQVAAVVKQVGTKQHVGSDDERTTVEVENILKTLRAIYKRCGSTPICFYEFVVNPASFTQTVENIFYTSFLIQGSFARIFLDADSLPVIEPIEDARTGAKNADSVQSILSMDMKKYKQIVDMFGITRSVLPHREYLSSDGADGDVKTDDDEGSSSGTQKVTAKKSRGSDRLADSSTAEEFNLLL